MTTENSFSKLTHTHSGEVKLKHLHGVADILKEIFRFILEGNVKEITNLLVNNELAEKSLNITLSKAFGAYNPSNKDSKDIIAVLLKYKADPNINLNNIKSPSKDRKASNAPFTGLMYAASENDVYLANILISYNCNVNIKDYMNRNALFYTISAGPPTDVSEMVNLLIRSGINVNQVDLEGYSPLTLAVSRGLKEVIRILLNSGADVDYQVSKDGNSALHTAVTNNRTDIIYLLLLRKPNLSIRNKSGMTPIDLAFNLSRTEVYQILAEEFHQRESNMKKLEEMHIANASSVGVNVSASGNVANYVNNANEYINNVSDRNYVNVNDSNNLNNANNSHGTNNTNSNNEIIIDEATLKEDEDIQSQGHNNQSQHSQNSHPSLSPNRINNNFNSVNDNYQSVNMNNKYYSQNAGSSGNIYPTTTIKSMSQLNSMSQSSNMNNPMNNNFNYQNMNMNNPSNLNTFNPNMNSSNPNTNNITSSLNNIPNINININTMTSLNTITNKNGVPISYKNTKNAKLQKLRYLQESRLYAEQTGRSIRDKSFKFPFGSSHSSTNIEIPFNFQANSEGKLNQSIGNKSKQSQLHTFIKIQSTPVLHIDISDENKQDQFILSSQLEELKMSNNNHGKKINQMENELNITLDENTALKMEINRMKEELINKEKFIASISAEFSAKEDQYSITIQDFKVKLEEKSLSLQNMCGKCEHLEKEIIELKNFSKYQLDIKGNKFDKDIANKKEFLEKKFSCLKYDEKYIIKCLQKDIMDFQEYTKEQIKKAKATQEELIKLIQDAVDDVMPEYEVKLYGSHATNLCLQWSDLDVVLVHKRNYNASNYQFLQSLYINLLEKPWKKSIKLIDSAVVPIIKMTSTEQYNNMHIDISLQDSKHYGLKCVELVRSFMKEYEALEPLIFALKNILKNANLNDPYTGGLSSYGLILMVVSFLQSQQENKKSIKISEGNLGRMFLEFLWYYGLMFDHSKYVIYAFPTNEVTPDKESINFLYNMQPSHELIIVDPLSKTNNVARSTYQFVNIKLNFKMAFMIGFVVSHEECECGCHFNKLGDEHSVYNSDHCILKRIFNSVKRFNASTPNS